MQPLRKLWTSSTRIEAHSWCTSRFSSKSWARSNQIEVPYFVSLATRTLCQPRELIFGVQFFFFFLNRAEKMISEEIEAVQVEADEIETGWSQSIWPLAMQLR